MARTNPTVYATLKSNELLAEQLVMLAGAISNWLVGMGADVKKVAATLGPHEAA